MTGSRAPRRTTILQVAELAGVSIKTVSRVTNGEAHVSPEVRQRVSAAIEKLGYQPMQSARALSGRRSGLLALVYDNPSPSYLVRVQFAARRCCEEHGLRLLFHPCDHRDAQLPAMLTRLAADLHLEGVLLVPPVSVDKAVIRALAEMQVPVSLLAPAEVTPGASAVFLDDAGAARTLTRHLLEAGHQRIGFVCGHAEHESTRARLDGYREELQKAGIARDESLVVYGDLSFASGRSAGAALLDRQIRPTAIMAGNDDMAAGVMATAHDRRLRIPQELAVCGFDDTPLASMLWPPLTTMRQPIAEMAYAGTRMLIDQIQQGQTAAPLHLPYQLQVRESTMQGLSRKVAR